MVCGFFLLGAMGCPNNGRDTEIINEKGGNFPDFLVGTWQMQDDKWELTFDSDGKISLIKHHFVTVPIVPAKGGAYEQGRDGAYSIYTMGPCIAQYDRASRELNVVITIDYFQVVLPVGKFEGKMTDSFRGRIYNGDTTWAAAWVSYVELDGAENPDPNSIQPVKVVFTKVQN